MPCNVLPWDFRTPVVKVVIPPAIEPLSLAEAKSHARIDEDLEVDDADVQRAITAAREFCEDRKGWAFVEQTLDYWLPCFPPSGWAVELPRATPLQSIVGVYFKDSTGAEQEWGSSNYAADSSGNLGMLVLKADCSLPSFTAWPVNPVRIRYVAGQAVESPALPFPSGIVMAMNKLVAHWYRNREAAIVGFQHSEIMALMVDPLLGIGQKIYTC